MVVSHHVGAESGSQVLCKSNKRSCPSTSAEPSLSFRKHLRGCGCLLLLTLSAGLARTPHFLPQLHRFWDHRHAPPSPSLAFHLLISPTRSLSCFFRFEGTMLNGSTSCSSMKGGTYMRAHSRENGACSVVCPAYTDVKAH